MTRKEKLSLLTDWKNSYIKLDNAYDKLSKAFGCHLIDSDIFDSAFMMFDRYTKTVAMLLDCNNTLLCHVEDWLSWYCYETNMGSKDMDAQADSWKKARKIKTVKDLLDIIEAE